MSIRIPLTIIVLLFLFLSAHAQDTTKSFHPGEGIAKLHKKHFINMPKYARNGYIAIMGGLGMPTAAFAANEGAATGSVFSISAAFPGVISHGGIAFKFDDGINGFNQNRLIGILNTDAGFANISCSVPAGTLGQCSYKTFLTGLYLTYPHKHLTIDARVLMGVMMSVIPALNVNYYDQTRNNNGILYEDATSGAAFAIDFGIEARYPVRPKLSVILSADYVHASPAFNSISTGAALTSYGSITQESGRETTITQPFDIFNLSLGVGYIISARPDDRSDGLKSHPGT